MAKKPPKAAQVDDDSPETVATKKATESDKKILKELRERYVKCVEHDRENRRKYRENMRFALVPGEQWDETTKKERGKDRPMYEFNEIRIKGKAIVNQIRANRPAAKITPAEEGDIELAEAMKAEIDQTQNASDADSVMDYAAHHQVFGGMGAERYVTKWQEDSVDRQDVLIEPVNNPLCLHADYACQKQDKSDARFWILESKMPKEEYKAKYPNAAPVDFEVDDDFDDGCDDDHVWVAEYWKFKPVTRDLALLSDGKTIDLATVQALPPGVSIVKRRKAPGRQICMYVCSGDAVLTEEQLNPETGEPEQVKEHLWAGKEFPFNVVYGEYTVIDGKVHWCGITEYGKDAQRALNWAGTSVYEAIASTPQSVTWVTANQAKGLLPEWAEAQRKNIGIRQYHHDPQSPGPPQTTPPASIPTALVSAMEMGRDTLKSSLGMPDDTLGEKGATNSGVAIRRRQEAGAVANFNYGDNMTNFARRRTEILIDLIPKVKDTPYTLRVVGKEGAEKYVKINEVDPMTEEKLNDLSALKYDLVVTQGPNFATQRQEAAETYMGLSQGNPQLMAVAGDVIVKNLDLPGAQEIAERLKATLPAQVLQLINADAQQDPAVVAAMEQVKVLEAQLQEQAALVEQEQAAATDASTAATKEQASVAVASANLKVQEAQLNQSVAEFKTLVAETQLKMAQQDTADAEQKGDDTSAQMSESLQVALGEIQQQAQGILETYAQQLAEFQAQTVQAVQQQVAVNTQPRNKRIITKRVQGNFISTVEDADTGEALQQIPTTRGPGGELVTTVQ
jgi:hypothetical protein